MDAKVLVKNLFEIIGILSSAFQDINQMQKEEVKAVLPEKFKLMCSVQQPVITTLLADDLGTVIKDLNKTSWLKQNLSQNYKGRSPFSNKGKGVLGPRKPYGNQYGKKGQYNHGY